MIPPLVLGGLRVAPAVWMAPMAGVTDSPFRRVLRRLGCPAVVTEMISAEGLLRAQRPTRALLAFDPEERPLFAQLFGREPARLAAAAEQVVALGFDGIDLNMGCPVPKIVRQGSGAALMRDPGRAEAIVRAVRKVVACPLTAKIRAGWSADEVNALEVAERLQDAGADAVALHARTRAQGYAGRADWALIGRLVARLRIPVLGNGDLHTPEDGERMRAETGCAGLMIGRGALGNPWLPRALGQLGAPGAPAYPPPARERHEVFCTHLGLMLAWVGSERHAVPPMRKHLIWYSRGLRGATELRRSLGRMSTAAELEAAFARLVGLPETENHGPEHTRS
ncbi:MAG TPA: tRNA dihydrouridine synthase DusB [Myxococcota bacterium]|nr:tRNA dihydrouridine synthase DusB [Myxococcota bacterium]HRY91958.1 tRNA dihydrouridine synthase DusB [Myxococcota bacterium]HSA20671.1 tRNA dihydrouridine synthase DusB [Myxococcota bacterium]